MLLSELTDLLQTRKDILNVNIDDLINYDNDVRTEEILNSETWEEELVENYIANSSETD